MAGGGVLTMPECLLDSHGQPLKIVGYASLFDSPITIDGQTEAIARGAFTPTLRRGAPVVRALVNHHRTTTWASVRAGTLKLWETGTGLAFSAMIQNTIAGRQLARAVAGGHTGVSFQCRPLKTEETASGYAVTAAMLTEISLIGEPAYATGAWLSDPDLMDPMPDHALALRRQWAEPRHDTAAKLRTMAAQVSALPRRAAASRSTPSQPRGQAIAARRAPAPLTLEDIYIPHSGFSSAELAKLAFDEATARRSHREAQAGRYALQRERNRWRRKAGRAA